MIGLDNLMKIRGVVAAGQFNEDGSLIRSVGEMTDEIYRYIAKACASNSDYFSKQLKDLSNQSGMNWDPLNGWAVWGGKYVCFVVGRTGVFAEASKVDFNEILVDLLQEEPTGARQMNM